MRVVHISGDRTMYVSLIHYEIAKVIEQKTIVRDVTIHIHQSSHLADVRGGVTTNSGIFKV